jgi:hypothetical protein
MKTLIDAKPWLIQSSLLPLPWKGDEDLLLKKYGKTTLRVAVIWDDGIVKPHPPVVRALQSVVDGLKGVDGVQIMDWKPYKHDLAWNIIVC